MMIELMAQEMAQHYPPDVNVLLCVGGGSGEVMARGFVDSLPEANVSVIVPTGDGGGSEPGCPPEKRVGGSTGIIREEFGGPAVGDVFKVVRAVMGRVAVQNVLESPRFSDNDTDEAVAELNAALRAVLPESIDAERIDAIFDHTIAVAKQLHRRTEKLHGHSYGNILMTGMRLFFDGDIVQAAEELSAWGEARATVIPVSAEAHDVVLIDQVDGKDKEIWGEGNADKYKVQAPNQVRVRLETGPDHRVPLATAKALGAVATADVIFIGPGSILTSLAPCLLPKGMTDALSEAKDDGCQIVGVANLVPEKHSIPSINLVQLVQFLERHDVALNAIVYNKIKGTLPGNVIPLYHDGSPTIGMTRAIGASLVGTAKEKADPNDAVAYLRGDLCHDVPALVEVAIRENLIAA